MKKYYILLLLFVASLLQAQYLNDISAANFVDIGKVSGFEEIQTPFVKKTVNPSYSIVENIISQKNRLLDVENCYIGSNGVESCPKDEIECRSSTSYGRNYSTVHTGTVTDYEEVIQNEITTLGIGGPYWKDGTYCYVRTDNINLNISDVSKINSFKLSHVLYDDWIQITINGTIVYNKPYGSYSKVVTISTQKLVQYDTIVKDPVFNNITSGALGCEQNGEANTYPDLELKNYLVNGENVISVQLISSGGGVIDATFTADSSAQNNVQCSSNPGSCNISNTSLNSQCVSSGYTYLPGTNYCTKTISYDYYTYFCDSGYSIADEGRTSCSKTDTDITINNEAELSANCNSPYPPSGNCYIANNICPFDSTRECAFSGSEILINIPLNKFLFTNNRFFKEWEFGNSRGWDCTTTSLGQIEDCKFGIQEIDATEPGKICFKDMQNYRNCIDYEDLAGCKLQGKVSSTDGMPLKGLLVSYDDTSLVPVNSNGDRSVFIQEDFNDGPQGWSNASVSKLSNQMSSFLGRLQGNNEKTYNFGVENANKDFILEFDFFKIDSWDNEIFQVQTNQYNVVLDTYNIGTLSSDYEKTVGSGFSVVKSKGVDIGDLSNLNTGSCYTGATGIEAPEELVHYKIRGKLDSQGQLRILFLSSLDEIACNESFGIDNISIQVNNPSASIGGITSNCKLNGKFGFYDVGLGSIAVKGDKNRLTFWNSYNNNMVGFVDFLPGASSSSLTDSIIKFDFKNYISNSVKDVSVSGASSELLVANSLELAGGISDNAIHVSEADQNLTFIKGGDDMSFNGLSEFSISFWIKVPKYPASEAVILDNDKQFSVKLSNGGNIRFYVNISGTIAMAVNAETIPLNTWTYVTLSFTGSEILSIINGVETTRAITGTIGGENSDTIVVGSDFSGGSKIEAYLDDITFYNKKKTLSDHNTENSKDISLPDYLTNQNDEIANLMRDGFRTLYKSDDNHVYMVYKDKITSSECLQKIQGTNFYLAVADANLSDIGVNILDRNFVDTLIEDNCRDTILKECYEFPLSEDCNNSNIADTNNSQERKTLISEIFKACEENKLIVGLSYQSQKYKYTLPGDTLNCIIESTDTAPIDFYDFSYIVKKTANTGNFINKFVCSPHLCSSDHLCGSALCPDDTHGNIGVDSGYTGCTQDSCDYTQPFYPLCGNYNGCPNDPTIFSELFSNPNSISKDVRIETGGFDISSAYAKHFVYIDGTRVMNMQRGWNLIIFDENLNIKEQATYDTFSSALNAEALKRKINSIEKGTTIILATFDEPSTNVVDNQALLDTMEAAGMDKNILKNLEYRSAYVFAGRKEELPIVERYVARYEDGIIVNFNTEKLDQYNKCYRIDCPAGSQFDPNTRSCFVESCDDKSILRNGKCISVIAD